MTSTSTSYSAEEAPTGATPRPEGTGATRLHPEALHLPQQSPPDLVQACILHGRSPGAAHVTVIMRQEALRQVADHSLSDLHCELGGALLGKPYQHNGRLYVEVEAALPAVTADHGPVHFTFTADAWAQLNRDRAARHPQLDIVGWFHTHPDLGIFYSSDDVVVHSAAFTQPWHVGLVVDPVSREMAFFGWSDGALAAYPGFYELRDQQPTPVIPWRAVRAEVWDHPYEYEAPAADGRRVHLAPAAWPSLGAVRPYAGFLLSGLGFLLAFFLLVAGVLPLTARVNQLETALLTLADEALAASNAAGCPDARVRLLSPLSGQRVVTGTAVALLGTADFPGAARYQVHARPVGGESWTLVGVRRWSTSLGRLAVWDTTPLAPAIYELRLTAVDRNNIRLGAASICTIQLEVTE
jgi:proteasome lid subunit RPN8/RPN11